MTTGTCRFILLFILLLIPTAATGGGTALITAAQSGDVAKVKKLLDAGADVEARTKDGRTALHEAAAAGNAAVVKLLLEHGADVEARLGRRTALHLATEGIIRADVVKRLLEAGADVEAREKDGRTPLALATRHATACSARSSGCQAGWTPRALARYNDIIRLLQQAEIERVLDQTTSP